MMIRLTGFAIGDSLVQSGLGQLDDGLGFSMVFWSVLKG